MRTIRTLFSTRRRPKVRSADLRSGDIVPAPKSVVSARGFCQAVRQEVLAAEDQGQPGAPDQRLDPAEGQQGRPRR